MVFDAAQFAGDERLTILILQTRDFETTVEGSTWSRPEATTEGLAAWRASIDGLTISRPTRKSGVKWLSGDFMSCSRANAVGTGLLRLHLPCRLLPKKYFHVYLLRNFVTHGKPRPFFRRTIVNWTHLNLQIFA